jgi:hypothetical protein
MIYDAKTRWKKIVAESRRRRLQEDSSLLDPDAGKINDSVDEQIDKYLSQYESESKTVTESKFFKSLVQRLLREKDGEEEEDPLADLGGEDEEGEDEEGGEEGEEEGGDDAAEEEPEEEEEAAPEKLTSEDIDLSGFANSVSRLVENSDSLLELKNTIIRRSISYIGKVYDKNAVDEFKEILSSEFGLEPGMTKRDKEERFMAPPAERAGAEGDGGGGGI